MFLRFVATNIPLISSAHHTRQTPLFWKEAFMLIVPLSVQIHKLLQNM